MVLLGIYGEEIWPLKLHIKNTDTPIETAVTIRLVQK